MEHPGSSSRSQRWKGSNSQLLRRVAGTAEPKLLIASTGKGDALQHLGDGDRLAGSYQRRR